MADSDLTYAGMSRSLIEVCPELRVDYEVLLQYWEDEEPGQYLVYEDILVPYIFELLGEESDRARQRLTAIFGFVERMACHPDQDIRNLAMVGVCESISGTSPAFYALASTFMGPETRARGHFVRVFMGHRSPDEHDPADLREHWLSLQERYFSPVRTPAPITYQTWRLDRHFPPAPTLDATNAQTRARGIADTQTIFELWQCGGIGIEGRITKYKGDRGWDLATGAVHPTRPVKVRHHGGYLPRDVIWATWKAWLHAPTDAATVQFHNYLRCLLVNQRCVDALRTGGVTGWRLFPVEFEGKRGEPIEGYHGLAITGRCGSIDLSAAWQVANGPGIHHAIRGVSIPQNLWDGPDLFVPATGEDFIFATQRARDAFASSEITGVWLERIDGSLDDTYRHE